MKLLSLLFLFTLFSCASVTKEKIVYPVDGIDHIGMIASGVKKGEKKPAVIIVHEWWGHNDYAKKRAHMLAQKGYVAMSIDMYGEGKIAEHPKDAGAFAAQTMKNFPLAKRKFMEAIKVLKGREDVDPNKIVALGYCFGGGIVLNMLRAGVNLPLIASFHGGIDMALMPRKGKIKTKKVLVFNGKDDPFVKASDLTKFERIMKNKVDLTVVNYPGVKHSFTNPKANQFGERFKLPLEYNKAADHDSWNMFLSELKRL